MIEDKSQEANIKSAFFSRPPQYPLEVNSVYRPKFSNLMTEKPFNKPFYAREDRRGANKGNSITACGDALTTSGNCNIDLQHSCSIGVFNAEPSPATPSGHSKEESDDSKMKTSEHTSVDNVMNDTTQSINIQKSVDSQSVSLSETEKQSEFFNQNPASPVETDSRNPHDISSFNESDSAQVSEVCKLDVANTFTPPLMELPSSVYVPPFHPVPPVILSHSVTAYPPVTIESLMAPMFARQACSQSHQQQQQQRKNFSKPKGRHVNTVPPMFHENGLYGMGIPQNGNNKEYYVMVHVEAGTTFSIRTGDQEQQIPGPATVRLDLNNGPPLPMPMQVPPGHLVQQIVDEDGVLTHVILSPMAAYSPYKSLPSGLNGGTGTSLPFRPPTSTATGAASIVPRFPAWPPRLGANGGVNVIISPKTSPGLAVAGPPWTVHSRPVDMTLQPPFPQPPQLPITEVISPPSENTSVILEQRRKLKRERQVVGKRETVEEAPDKSVLTLGSSTPGRLKKQPSSGKKKGVTTGGTERKNSSGRGKKSRKVLSVEATNLGPFSAAEQAPKTASNCNGGENEDPNEAQEAAGQSKNSAFLRDDYASVTFAESDDNAAVGSVPQDSKGTSPVNASSSQRPPKPVNVVRPTNGGRPLTVTNGDLTPAEACELKASLGRASGSPRGASASPVTSPPVRFPPQPDNVWAARKLAALGGDVTESPAVITTAATDQPPKSGEKSKDTSTTKPASPGATSGKQGLSEKHKKTSKNGDTSKQKGVSESGPSHKKLPKKVHQQTGNGYVLSSTATSNPTTTSTSTLDVTETAPTLLPNTTQHHYYPAPPFYTAGAPPSSSFFLAPPHAHFGPPPPPSCFMPPPPPPHLQQTHHSSTQPAPPYLFSPGNPSAVVAGTPYFSFQLPPPPIAHGLTGSLHPAAGAVTAGAPLLSVPHTLPFVTPTTAAEAVAAAAAAVGAGAMGMAEDENSAIIHILSKIAPPKVSSVDCRSVTINISIPEDLHVGEKEEKFETEGGPNAKIGDEDGDDTTDIAKTPFKETIITTHETSGIPSHSKSWSIPTSDLRFVLYLAERNENFVCVYVGEVTCILLQDLRPGVQYTIKVCCMYAGLCGAASESTEFVTLATKPACPRPPNVFARTKNTLSVRWAVPADNGAKITSYCLEYATITKGGGTPLFQVCYTGTQRFHKLSHLLPATTYILRVAASNAHGQGPWSEVVSVMTYGLPPSAPDPPRLIKATTHSLHLTWEPLSRSQGTSSAPSKPILRYQLEMQEGEARQHFKKVFDNDATKYVVEGLRRCCLYRFRLAASNVDGTSPWSDIVAFRTAPDLPSAPRSLRLRGRVRPFHVNLCWLAPDDDGGMPVSAYRLEIFMPLLPAPLLRKYTTQLHQQQHKKDGSYRLCPTTDSEEIQVTDMRAPICWPWVIAASDNNAFISVPPSNYVLQSPVSSFYSLGKMNDVPRAPFRVPSSPDSIKSPGEESITVPTSVIGFSESSDNEAADSLSAWYVIYEGRSTEVTVCNLTPGQSFQFRVRATSQRPIMPSHFHPRSATPSAPIPWGQASTSPLKVTTPAVPPINPPSNLRLVGRSKPTELRFMWDPPTSNGGAPILSYELWQSLYDPISGSLIKTTPCFEVSPPLVGLTSESMRDLHTKVEPLPLTSSVSTTGGILSAPSSVTSSPQHRSNITSHSRPVFAGVENSCEVRGLHSGQVFAFRLRARNSTGWSEWSEWSTFATAPSPPAALDAPPRVIPKSPTTVAVSWDEVEQTNGAPITEYRVEWQPCVAEPSQTSTPPEREHNDELLLSSIDSNSASRSRNLSSCSSLMGIPKYPVDGFQLVYSGVECRFELHDLQPASRIAFRVCAVNAAGAGGWSPVGSCVMPASRPDQPTGLALDLSPPLSSTGTVVHGHESENFVGGVSMTTARLVWTAPFDNGCPITSYTLELTRYIKSHASTSALLPGTGYSDTKYLPLYVDVVAESVPPLPPSLSPPINSSSDQEEVMERNESIGEGRRTNDEERASLRDICIPGPPNLHLQPSPSLSIPVSVTPSPLPSLGIDSGSALSSIVSSESSQSNQHLPHNHHQHPQQRYHRSSVSRVLGFRACHLPGAVGTTDYVRYTLAGLEVGTKYRARVQALNAVGASPFSGILHFSTLPSLPPQLTLFCIGTTASGIRLRWSPSTATSYELDDAHPKSKPSATANVKYILEMSKKPESKGWVSIFEGTQTSFKARKLSEATLYCFRVAAVNISGKGPFSEILQEKTAYSQPPPVEAPQVIDVCHTKCKLQWPPLSKMGQDPLLYLVQLTRVPGTSNADATKTTVVPSSPSEIEYATASGTADETREEGEEEGKKEEEAVTVYRGADTSCTVNNLSSGTNYIARVCAIRCCQSESLEHLHTLSLKSEGDPESMNLQAPLLTSSSNSTSAKITLLNGPFSTGTAFTTLSEERTLLGVLINSMIFRSPFCKRRTILSTPLPSSRPASEKSPTPLLRRPLLMVNQVNHLIVIVQRLRVSAPFRRISNHSATSSRERAQRRMACLFVIGFVLLTLFCAWFANQFLLKFSDDVSPAVKWPGGDGSLEDSSSSARAALYATRGRQLHQ